ncbi:MAG: hypothetical protein Hyperionvirus3_28 [Hyperionvirus sp.]|uniref:VWFA domain-containing protein n=1 Tax=Hyperionvirus sp. TaxID=2487770 RepID=A0A3G5A767_9VIRU|nr:MAG: hypothetical protein Hyperionvirus3_28 [Hyperionvirus sp.]
MAATVTTAKTEVVTEGVEEFGGISVGVIGFNGKYKYYIRSYEKELKSIGSIPVLMFDFSFSMLPNDKNGETNSAKAAQEAMDIACGEMFERGIDKIILIFFGATAYLTEVTKSTYKTVILESLRYYYDSGDEQFNKYSKFRGDGTCPEVAMSTLLDHVIKNKEPSIYEVIFMTDGDFNGHQVTSYPSVWESLTTAYDKASVHTFRFNSIGYKGDLLKNITDMKTAFDRSSIYERFAYVSINSGTEIVPTVQKLSREIEDKSDIKVRLPNGLFLHLGVPIYSKVPLIDEKNLIATELLRSNYDSQGVTRDWVVKVMTATCEISLRTAEIRNEMALITDPKNYQKVFAFMNTFSRDYIDRTYTELRTTFKSIKTRKIPIWAEFCDTANEFRLLYNRVQDLVSGTLDDKKKFEQQTAITANLDERHRRNLQRRRAANERQGRKDVDVCMEILNESPLVLEVTSGEKKFEVMMDPSVSKRALNETFSCFLTLESWEESPLLCVTARYLWDANNDWNPGRSRIEQVGTAAFISLEGFDEMQKIFGAAKGFDHAALYKNEGYIKVAQDASNTIVPIATDPTFMGKVQTVKDHLAHMIAGSNYAYAARHINFYIAVIRQCIHQMIQQPTEKLDHITILLINTFRLLTQKINPVYDEKQLPMPRTELLYNIAIGNTAPRFFSTPWECTIYALISSDKDFKLAQDKYNTEMKTSLKMPEFKHKVWQMVYRHFIISRFERDAKWEDPVATWGLKDASEITAYMKDLTEVQKLSHDEAIVKVNSLTMTADKLNTIPKYIHEKLTEQMNATSNVFKMLLNYADRFCDAFWEKFNLSFMPIVGVSRDEFKDFLANPSLTELVMWTNWECNILGYKDCYPITNHASLTKQVVARVNSHYGEILRNVIGDAYEYMEFKNRDHETRALPVCFTTMMETKMVELFTNANKGTVDEKDFRSGVQSILGESTSRWFEIALKEDGIDVLGNLFKYCKGGLRRLDVTKRGLPYSRPGNPTSPLFLQLLTNEEFSSYYRAIGFGYASKKYRNWCDDLHPYMINRVTYMKEEEFVKDVVAHAHSCNLKTEGKDCPSYVREYYRKFRNV